MSQSANLASFSIYGSRYPGGSVVATMAEPNVLRLDGGSTGSEANPTLILQINKNLSIPESNKFYLGAYTFSISTRITNQESSSFGGFRSVSLYKGSPSDMDSAVLQNAITSQFLTQTSGTHTISFTIRNHIDGPFFLVIVLRSNSTFYYDDYTVSVTFEKESYQGTVELTNGTDGNLLPLFTGNPSWYSKNGYYRTDRDLVISTNSDGSISLEGIADTEDCYKLFVPLDASDGALLGAGTTTSDLYLDTGTYEIGYVTDGDDSSYSKIEVDIYGINGLNRGRIGGASSKSSALVRIGETATELQPGPDYYYLVVDPKTTDFSTKLTFKPYLYRQGEKPEELSPPVVDGQPPVISGQPQSVTVSNGQTATFAVTASGIANTYSWEASSDNGAHWISLGFNTNSISFAADLSQNGYKYQCKVSNDYGTVTSNAATLTVTSSSGGNDNPTDPTNPGGNDTPSNPTNPSNPSAPGTSTNTHTELSELFTGTQSYTFPEDYFSSGRIYWRVRSYDSDGNPGEWSESVSFICYGVSKIQNLECDAKPFATITWTANGQVSYEIKIDDSIGYGPFHGTDGRFVLAEPLEDGHHKVSVRVQNNLGLESPWDEIEFDVQNIPSDNTSSQFVVQADVDASLWWTPPSVREEDEFLVYRDDKLIRRFDSSVTSFSDRVVLGYHTYKVIQHLPSGYYNLYTHPEVFLTTDITKIGLLSGGPWLNLALTTDRHPTNTFKQTRIIERTRIMGSKYPVVEISDFEELSATYEVVWPFEKREAAYQFKKLLGKAVIVKSRGEQVVVGVLDGYELPVNSKTVGYTFTIEQMDFDDDLSIIVSPDDGFGLYTDLDKIAFGLMNKMDLESVSTNPGTSNPQHYEQIAEAINELKRYIAVLQSEATANG